jgi:glutaredoxin
MKLFKSCLLLCWFTLVVQLFLPPVSYAKLYTWTDRNGTVRRTYYPPPADQVRKDSPSQPSVQQPVGQNQVELYVTSWCPYCEKAIEYFQSRGVAYKVYDIEKDKQAAARKQQLDGRRGVPFAVVNGKRIHGYAPDAYGAALAN